MNNMNTDFSKSRINIHYKLYVSVTTARENIVNFDLLYNRITLLCNYALYYDTERSVY